MVSLPVKYGFFTTSLIGSTRKGIIILHHFNDINHDSLPKPNFCPSLESLHRQGKEEACDYRILSRCEKKKQNAPRKRKIKAEKEKDVEKIAMLSIDVFKVCVHWKKL